MKRRPARFAINWQLWTIKNKALCALLLLCLSNCQTTPTKITGTTGQFEAKVLINDIKHHRSFILYLKANAIKDEQLRLDLTSSLGGHVASLVLQNDDLKYINVPQKKFLSGPARPESLRPLLAIPLDPKWLYRIFFDEPIAGVGWTCEMDARLQVKDCQNSQLKIRVAWSERFGAKRTVTVEHEMGRLQMNFQNWKPALDSRANLFVLEAPAGFHKAKP